MTEKDRRDAKGTEENQGYESPTVTPLGTAEDVVATISTIGIP